jgi:predicted TIM-barrel fold metal-dependent hydrolase
MDEYGMSGVLLNTGDARTNGGIPVELEIAFVRAVNDYNREIWFEHDPRYYGSISLPIEQPAAAVEEIVRCVESSDRWRQILLGSRNERPPGNPKYWPVWEAAAEYGLPVAFHPGVTRYNAPSGAGSFGFYYEFHVGFSQNARAIVPSFVFEGVFDRIPNLKIVLTELAWAWAVPFSWRLDATWRVLKDEVAHLERRPSEYFRDHFWFTTQPAEEPEDPRRIVALWEQFAAAGFADKLLYSSDYPHWDFDPPGVGIPRALPRETKAKLLAGNAAELYRIAV